MEEEKGEDEGRGNDGQALAMRESGRCATLAIVMNLLRHTSYRDRVLPMRVTGGSLTLIRNGTCPKQLWVASAILQSFNHV